MSALFGAKHPDFSKFMVIRTDKGVEPMRVFYRQGKREKFFAIL